MLEILNCGLVQTAITLVALGFGAKVFFKKQAKAKLANLQIKWNAAGKDVVILHQFPRARYCPNPSPYPIKLETFLRMNNIKYVNDFDEAMSDKQKSPWITINGENISDSQLAIEYLTKKFNLDVNKGLDDKDLSVSRAMRFLIEQDFYWCLVQDRWVYPGGKHVPELFAPWEVVSLPTEVERFLIVNFASKMIAKQSFAQGMGRHSREEVESMGIKDLEAISTFLGNKTFMFGDEVTELDCVVFGFLCMILFCSPKESVYYNKVMKDLTNLVDFTERIKEKYWPDWADARYKP
jgi:hypothetical protein